MVEETDDLVLTLLREIRGDVKDLRERMISVEVRLTTVATQLGQLGSTEQIHYGVVQSRFDRMETRLDRIERRLDLAPAP
jgi:DNA polymerase II large subunit